jgi:hypothetical protein
VLPAEKARALKQFGSLVVHQPDYAVQDGPDSVDWIPHFVRLTRQYIAQSGGFFLAADKDDNLTGGA